MKKFFTLIAAVAMAASVNAQTAKVFKVDTYWQASQANVNTAITEKWVAAGSGATAANGKKGSINPETKEEVGEGKFKCDAIGLKSGNDSKKFKAYVSGLSSLEAYGVTTSSSDTRFLVVTATPMEGGDAISAKASSASGFTAVAKVELDANESYELDITGIDSQDETKGADIALHGIWFYAGTTTGITNINASASAKSTALYNLAGQQVSKDYKGVVIQNGKKFLNK